MSFETSLAARAALAGWTLGSTRNGRSDFQRVSGYDPIPVRMAPCHPLDAWIAWSKHLESGKRPELLAETVDRHLKLNREESTFGFRNIRNGLTSPLSGAFGNIRPTGSEAVLRAAFWGLAWHGDPDTAARYAYNDASLDHSGEGVWIPVAVAATVAAARPGKTASESIQSFTDALPAGSRLQAAISEIRRVSTLADCAREFRLHSVKILDQPDLTDAVHSGAHILLALQTGQGDPGKSMLTAASCGGASAHTTGVVGCITALLAGSVAEEWLSPVGNDYIGSFVLRNLEAPTTVTEWASLIGKVWTPKLDAPLAEQITLIEHETPVSSPEQPTDPTTIKSEPDSPPTTETIDPLAATVTVDPEVNPVPIEPAPETSQRTDSEIDKLMAELEAQALTNVEPSPSTNPTLSPETRRLLTGEPNFISLQTGETIVRIRYLNRPYAIPTLTNEVQFEFETTTPEPKNIELSLETPPDWEVATKMTACALHPGETTTFAAIAKPKTPEAANTARLSLKVDEIATIVPIARALPWMLAAPFFNADGLGYEKPYPPENGFDPDQYMNGRSDMPVKWQKEYFPGNVYDLEPYFKHGPGVAYIYSEIEFEKPGQITVLAAINTGLKLWADGKRIMAYHDKRTPLIRPEGQYGGSFLANGPVRVLVKILRGNEPVMPLTLVFYDEDGEAVSPIRQTP